MSIVNAHVVYILKESAMVSVIPSTFTAVYVRCFSENHLTWLVPQRSCATSKW